MSQISSPILAIVIALTARGLRSDVLIIARPALVTATHEELSEAVARLLRRGGVLEGSNSA